ASYLAPDLTSSLGGMAYAKATALVELAWGEAALSTIRMEYQSGSGMKYVQMKPGDKTVSYSLPKQMTAKYSAEITNVFQRNGEIFGLDKFSYVADEEMESLTDLVVEYEDEETSSQRKAELLSQIKEKHREMDTEAYAFFNIATAGGLYTVPAAGYTYDEKTNTMTVYTDMIEQGDDFTTGITVEYQASDPDTMWEQESITFRNENNEEETYSYPVITVKDEREETYPLMQEGAREYRIYDLLPDGSASRAALEGAIKDLEKGNANLTEADLARGLEEFYQTETGKTALAEMKAQELQGIDENALITEGFWQSDLQVSKTASAGNGGAFLLTPFSMNGERALRLATQYTDPAGNTYTLPEAIKLRNEIIMDNIQGMKTLMKNYSSLDGTKYTDEEGNEQVFKETNPFGEVGSDSEFQIKNFGLVTEKNANITDLSSKENGGAMTMTFYQDFASAVDELMMPKLGYDKSVYEYNGYTLDAKGEKVPADPIGLVMYSATTYYKKDGSLITDELEKYDGTAAAMLETYIYKNPEVPSGNPFRWTRIQMATVAPNTPSPVYNGGFVAPLNTWRPYKYTDANGEMTDPVADARFGEGSVQAAVSKEAGNTYVRKLDSNGGSSFNTAAGQSSNGAGWSFQIVPKHWDDYSNGTKWGLVSFGLAAGGAAVQIGAKVSRAQSLADMANKGKDVAGAARAEQVSKGIKILNSEGKAIGTIQGKEAVEAAMKAEKRLVYALSEEGEYVLTTESRFNAIAPISGNASDACKAGMPLTVSTAATINDLNAAEATVMSFDSRGPAGASANEIEQYANVSYNESRDYLRWVSEGAKKDGALKDSGEAQNLKNEIAAIMNEEAALAAEAGYTKATGDFGQSVGKGTAELGLGIAIVSWIPGVNLASGVTYAVAGAGAAGIGFISTAIADNKLAALRRRTEALMKKKEALKAKCKAYGIPSEEEEKNKGGGGAGGGDDDGSGSGTGTGGGDGTGGGSGTGGGGSGGTGGTGGTPGTPSDSSGGGTGNPPKPGDDEDDSPTNNTGNKNNKTGKTNKNGNTDKNGSTSSGNKNSGGKKKDSKNKPGDVKVEGYPDPSGVVYEAVLSNPLEGAEVSIYTNSDAVSSGFKPVYEGEPGGKPANAGSASAYSRLDRPASYLMIPGELTQVTDADGRYQWDVKQGIWYVKAKKQGYT
ncbi:MAG: hypothetical protein IJU50_08830, partial [Lachnospiraceae bacterium]|nr:hypothetical protein [Lachnospiraceae bacterium]